MIDARPMLRTIAAFLLLALFSSPRLLDAEPAALIKIDGSSTVFPITEAVAEEFQKANRGAVRVTVGISGTGGGFKKFCRGDTDIQDASRPISAEEIEACRKTGVQYLELPIAFDALTIAVSQQNTWVDSITVSELKTIWEPSAQGRITKWIQVRSPWPDAPLKLFGAGSDWARSITSPKRLREKPRRVEVTIPRARMTIRSFKASRMRNMRWATFRSPILSRTRGSSRLSRWMVGKDPYSPPVRPLKMAPISRSHALSLSMSIGMQPNDLKSGSSWNFTSRRGLR